MLNMAIIGPGAIADRFLAPGISKANNVQLWSVLSRDLGRAKAFAEKHQAAAPSPAYDSLSSLLKDPKLDAVLIATTDPTHAEIGIQAANAGKHVFCEKPLCTSTQDGVALLDAVKRANVRLGVAYHLRWHIGHRLLWRQVQDGALGELRHLRIQWTYQASSGSNWRAHPESGRWWSLAGMGTHCVDLARWFLRPSAGEVADLKCLTSEPVYHQGNDEIAMLSMRFASGATAQIVTSTVFDSSPAFEIYGSKGAALCHKTLGPHGAGQITLNGQELAFTPEDPYVGEINDFVSAIEEGRPPEVDGEEGLQNVNLLLRAVPREG